MPPQVAKSLGIMGAIDLIAGIVLALVGVSNEMRTLIIVGIVLLISGGAMLAFVAWRSNRPQQLS